MRDQLDLVTLQLSRGGLDPFPSPGLQCYRIQGGRIVNRCAVKGRGGPKESGLRAIPIPSVAKVSGGGTSNFFVVDVPSMASSRSKRTTPLSAQPIPRWPGSQRSYELPGRSPEQQSLRVPIRLNGQLSDLFREDPTRHAHMPGPAAAAGAWTGRLGLKCSRVFCRKRDTSVCRLHPRNRHSTKWRFVVVTYTAVPLNTAPQKA